MYEKWLPVVDEERCTGCNLCVEACGPKCLEVQGSLAVRARPLACGSEEHCIAPCPEKAIRMVWVRLEGDHSVGKWRLRRGRIAPQDPLAAGAAGPAARRSPRYMGWQAANEADGPRDTGGCEGVRR